MYNKGNSLHREHPLAYELNKIMDLHTIFQFKIWTLQNEKKRPRILPQNFSRHSIINFTIRLLFMIIIYKLYHFNRFKLESELCLLMWLVRGMDDQIVRLLPTFWAFFKLRNIFRLFNLQSMVKTIDNSEETRSDVATMVFASTVVSYWEKNLYHYRSLSLENHI